MIIDNPEIEWCERTGYPSWKQPKEYHCESCVEDITDEPIYEDEEHDYLCEHCLMYRHEKRW